MSDCLFCKIIAGDLPSDRVYEDDAVVAFRDIHPVAPTHVLVVPRVHIPDASLLGTAPGGTLDAVYAAANHVARAEGIVASGFRLVFNVGPDSGMLVPHLHLHVLGGRALGGIVSASRSDGAS